MKIIKTVILGVLCSLGLASCQRSTLQQDLYIRNYQMGCMQAAELGVSKGLQKDWRCHNEILFLLDRGTMRFANGCTQEAIGDYARAIDLLNGAAECAPDEELAQIFFDERVSVFKGEDFERVLARVYFALALFQAQDQSNALALLKQAEDVQQRLKELYRDSRFYSQCELIENPVAKFLLAVALEKQQDSNAAILYNQVANLLDRPVAELKGSCPLQPTIVVVVHNGNAPYKISAPCDASVASAAAFEWIMAASGHHTALCSLPGIYLPLLVQNMNSNPMPLAVAVNGRYEAPYPFYHVTATAFEQLEQKKPLLAAKALARLALRRAVVAYANAQDPCLGALTDFALFCANACTEADTRSWRSLPSRIDIARFDVEPGKSILSFQVPYRLNPPFKNSYILNLKAGDLCLINVFMIHPGMIYVHIPARFLLSEGNCL